jgi:hypothetical protein
VQTGEDDHAASPDYHRFPAALPPMPEQGVCGFVEDEPPVRYLWTVPKSSRSDSHLRGRRDSMRAIVAAAILPLLWQPAGAETMFVVCDNGLRCFRPPCPARDVLLLPSRERLPRTDASLDRLSQAERKRVMDVSGTYDGSIVFGGDVNEEGNPRVIARRIVRNATKAEAALCRSRK